MILGSLWPCGQGGGLAVVRSPVRTLPPREYGGALVVWPGMPFPNLDGRIHQSLVFNLKQHRLRGYIGRENHGWIMDHLESWLVVRTQYNPVRTTLYLSIVSYHLVLLRLSTYFLPQVRTKYVLLKSVCTQYVPSTESMIKVRTSG
jgi:hypothetical protein